MPYFAGTLRVMRTTRIAAILLLVAAAGCQKHAAAQAKGHGMDEWFEASGGKVEAVPRVGARGWAALCLAAKFQEALVILEADRAAAGAVDRLEPIRDRAKAR